MNKKVKKWLVRVVALLVVVVVAIVAVSIIKPVENRYGISPGQEFTYSEDGEDITSDEIKAKFEDGVLRLDVPKKEEVKKLPEKHTIMIE